MKFFSTHLLSTVIVLATAIVEERKLNFAAKDFSEKRKKKKSKHNTSGNFVNSERSEPESNENDGGRELQEQLTGDVKGLSPVGLLSKWLVILLMTRCSFSELYFRSVNNLC